MNWKFRCFVLITLMMLYFAIDEWVKYLGAKERWVKNAYLFYIGFFIIMAIGAIYSAWQAW